MLRRDDFDPYVQLNQFALKPCTGEDEYQRTIGALFCIFWLMRTHLDGKERRALGVPKAALRFFASPKSAETMPQLEITWSVDGLEAPSGGFCGLAFGVLGCFLCGQCCELIGQ